MSGFSASVSGIQASFSRQSVTSNNLANVNTPGFKGSRAEQSTVQAGGTQVDSTSRDTSQGPLLSTGRPTDTAIAGDGYFAVKQDGGTRFTRSGSFGLDGDGNLVNTATGGRVLDEQGNAIQVDDASNLSSLSIGSDGTVTGTRTGGETESFGQVGVAKVTNPEGLSSAGDSLLSETANSGEARLGTPGQGSRGELRSGVLEASNVDMADELLSTITSEAGVEANVGAAQVQDEMMGTVLDLMG